MNVMTKEKKDFAVREKENIKVLKNRAKTKRGEI